MSRPGKSASEQLSELLRRPKNHSQSEAEKGSSGLESSRDLRQGGDLSTSRPLSLTKAQQLERQAWGLAPDMFQGLAAQDRVVLMEIACEPDSALTAAVQSYMGASGAAVRAALWNSCDLGTTAGVRLILDRIQVERPQQVWMSPPSGSFSPLQNTHQGTEAQKQQLQQKRREAVRVYVGAACVFHECMKLGIHCTWEMSEQSNAWRLPLLQRLKQKYGLQEVVTKGCAVNLRHDKSGKLMRTGWKMMTSHARMAEVMRLPCRCRRDYEHGKVMTMETPKSVCYTPEMCKRLAQVMCRELDNQTLRAECQGQTSLPSLFGMGRVCTCSETKLPECQQVCGSCMHQDRVWQLGCECQNSHTKIQVSGQRGGVGESGVQGDPPGPQEGMSTGSSYNPPRAEAVDSYYSQEQRSQVEAHAQDLLAKQDYSYKACAGLLEQCRGLGKVNNRRMAQGQDGMQMILGRYVYGSFQGVSRATTSFPNTVLYVNSYLRQHLPREAKWTSVAVTHNIKTPIHRDLQNHPGFDNWLHGLGDYTGGELWVETPADYSGSDVHVQQTEDGKQLKGCVHATRHAVVRFPPKAWHGTCAFQGSRFVLTAYVCRGYEQATEAEQKQLEQGGFPVGRLREGERREEKEIAAQADEAQACVTGGERAFQPNMSDERIKKQLYLLHAATGHGSTRNLVEALRRRGTSERVLKLAQDFQCPVCQEKQKVGTRHVSTLEPLPPKLSTISADIGHWRHPRTGEHVQFMLIIDETSRFRTAKVLTRGLKQSPSAAACLQYLQEGWCEYFGAPRVLRLDPAGAFRSQAVEAYCDRHSIHVDLIPGEAHHQIGVCEQAVKGIKEVMGKLCDQNPELTVEEALSTSVNTFNCREVIRGFSPMQHLMGQNPDLTGRFMAQGEQKSAEKLIENPTGEIHRAAQLRAEAEKAHADWNASQRIKRAMNSRTKPSYDYVPGELIYYWRSQDSEKGRRQPGGKHGRFQGPARILAVETRRNEQGQLRPGSAVWCVRGRSLIKCAPEQIRRASEREGLLESLVEGQRATPWTFTKVAEEIGGNQYQDVTQDVPSVQEWQRAQDLEEEEPPRRIRLHGKRPGPASQPASGDPEELPPGDSDEELIPAERPRVRARASREPAAPEQAGHWCEDVRNHSWEQEPNAYWQQKEAAVEVAIEWPEAKRAQELAMRDMSSYFIGAMKRRAAEVSEKRMTEEERKLFASAKAVEVRNFVAAKAFEIVPEHQQPSKEQAMNMRWILTWKLRDDGTSKPKARAVILGYQDPGYEHRATTSPVMNRQTRQFLLQVAANRKWSVYKGDVSGAFLQGRPYPEDLFCIPCPEICEAMSIPAGTVTKMKRACYGVVDAPLEWYRTVSEFLAELGFERQWSDACSWVKRKQGKILGMVAGHVDDFLFTGEESDPEWQDLISRIKAKFNWGDWDKDVFCQCGVSIKRTEEGFELSQPQYVAGIPEIPVSAGRRKNQEESTSEREKTQLRALLGALSWHAQQVAPHISAEVSLLLSEVSCSTVQTILKANTLLYNTKARKEHKMLIHGFDPREKLALYGWVDAASQNRPDGGSTQGIFVGLGPEGILHGEIGHLTPIAWHSMKIDRACRSPGAAEAQAAINGDDSLYYARYQWGEILTGNVDVRNPASVVQRVPACIVTDSRNVFDKLETEVLSIKGAEKRTNIEMISLKESQQSTKVEIRWVHSEAQLANALTKVGNAKELELFYRMHHRWRIVEDPQMRSARRRRTEGLDPLHQDQGDSSNSGVLKEKIDLPTRGGGACKRSLECSSTQVEVRASHVTDR